MWVWCCCRHLLLAIAGHAHVNSCFLLLGVRFVRSRRSQSRSIGNGQSIHQHREFTILAQCRVCPRIGLDFGVERSPWRTGRAVARRKKFQFFESVQTRVRTHDRKKTPRGVFLVPSRVYPESSCSNNLSHFILWSARSSVVKV
jgi:hypothetical protein